MFNTFNMGVGMSVVVPDNESEKAVKILKSNGVEAYVVGRVEKSERKIGLC